MKERRPSSSAQTVALARAHLDWLGVIDDPFAAGMLTRRRRAFRRLLQLRPLQSYGRSATFSFLAARTRFFDEAVKTAASDGAMQVVVVGAGYDTRPWRLAAPSLRFFEVDHPATQRDKQRRAPAGQVIYVPADLLRDRVEERLPAAGFDWAAPAAFVVEGLTMYLPETAGEALFRSLASVAAPRSRLAVNFTTRGGGSVSAASRATAWAIRASWSLTGEVTYHWATQDWVASMLPATGWQPIETLTGPQLAQRYLATTPMVLDSLNHNAFCVAASRRRDDGRRPVHVGQHTLLPVTVTDGTRAVS